MNPLLTKLAVTGVVLLAKTISNSKPNVTYNNCTINNSNNNCNNNCNNNSYISRYYNEDDDDVVSTYCNKY